MTAGSAAPARLVIVGGGLTGAALLIHLVRAGRAPLAVDIVEPAADLGRGVAYGTRDPDHRINVPSRRMSLIPDDTGHLTRWLFARGVLPDPASTDAEGDHYIPRAAFGAYAGDVLAETLAAAGPRLHVRHHRARATSVAADAPGWGVALDDGRALRADGVALCCGHPAPVLPCPVSEAAARHPGFVPNPWRRDAFAAIGPHDAVLLVGTGLTMMDAVASLDAAGHRGPVSAISRRGLLPRPQGAFLDGFDPFADMANPGSALGLLRVLRRHLAISAPEVGWQPVLDAFRTHLRRIWPALPPEEQRRVVRRLLPLWEVHRFRASPQARAVVEAQRQAGRLTVERARIAGVDADGGRLLVTLSRPGLTEERRFCDAVVLCTGPGSALRADPLVAGLLASGLAEPDAVGLGVAVDAESRLRGGETAGPAALWALGPVTRGSFGEMTGEPDIVSHLARIAPGMLSILAAACAARRGGPSSAVTASVRRSGAPPGSPR